jgi:hypothetical protein
MPTNRGPLYHSRRGLSATQEMAFWLGTPAPFASEDEARELWFVHRERLLELFGRPGRRPLGWWRYEAAEHGLSWPGYDRERSVLFAGGLLDEAEAATLVREWRRQFERAWRPGFFHCEGPDAFFHGPEAQQKHFTWADIPAALVEKWSEERRHRPAAEEQTEGCPA